MNKNTYGADWPNNSIISQYGELFRIRENRGESGIVERLDGSLVSTHFTWTHFDNKAQMVISGKDHVLMERVNTLVKADPERREKLIYEWVKTNRITFKQFSLLCRIRQECLLTCKP